MVHKHSKYLYEDFEYVILMFLKYASSKYLNLECQVLALGVQFLKCASRKVFAFKFMACTIFWIQSFDDPYLLVLY